MKHNDDDGDYIMNMMSAFCKCPIYCKMSYE